jgi:hypothetical protein
MHLRKPAFAHALAVLLLDQLAKFSVEDAAGQSQQVPLRGHVLDVLFQL